MPDILIRGMKMPTEGGAIGIYKISGNFYAARVGKDELFPIVELPEHGDLVDVNTAYDKIAERETSYYMDMDGVDAGLQATPVIVPASEEATNDPKT